MSKLATTATTTTDLEVAKALSCSSFGNTRSSGELFSTIVRVRLRHSTAAASFDFSAVLDSVVLFSHQVWLLTQSYLFVGRKNR